MKTTANNTTAKVATKKDQVSFIRETALLLDRAAEGFGWSNPIDQVLNAARAEEKRHRSGSGRYGISVEDAAKCLTVRDLAAYISGERKPITIGELLEVRHSAALACATVQSEKYGAAIRAVFTPEMLKQALALDYAELVK